MRPVLLCCCLCVAALAATEPDWSVSDLAVRGSIAGENITFTVAMDLRCQRETTIQLIDGAVVLDRAVQLPERARLILAPDQQGYWLELPRGEHRVEVVFAVLPRVLEDGEWREASFAIPASRKRELRLDCDRSDLEVDFPGALRQERELHEGSLAITALLGPGLPFAVRWKPQVAELAADLVFATESNVVASVNPGSLRLDEVVVFDVSQGRLTECRLAVPSDLAITRVEGPHIRTWRIDEDTPEGRVLVVELVREVGKRYALRVEAERALGELPASSALPGLRPLGALRSHGHLLLGTDSALQLVVASHQGCTQTDLGAFRPLKLQGAEDRATPRGTAFAFAFPALPYAVELRLADIVPSYDANDFLAVAVREDDLVVDWRCELDIRDAPLRELSLALPPGMTVAALSGTQVDADGAISAEDASGSRLTLPFLQPVQGRVLLQLRLERGRSPLDEALLLPGPRVIGAGSERGALVVAIAEGVRLTSLQAAEGLKQVHAGTLPIQVPGAQQAWRFREPGWNVELRAERRLAGIRAEAFHLLSVGEGICYGNVVLNYVITGAPVDELQIAVDPRLGGVEFVGADVVRAQATDGVWTVKLRRKVIGDYNLGVAFTRVLAEGEALPLTAVSCRGFDNETGYVVLASHRNVDLASEPGGEELLAITDAELPAHYRLLVSSPILRSWKYVNRPRQAQQVGLHDLSEGRPLAAIIELMDLQTQLSIRDDGEIESHTRASYKIKNAHEQFVDLRLPPGARPWGGVYVVDAQGRRRATVSELDGTLKVSLQRQRNPNDPLTVELEYGQSHGTVGSGQVDLQAPQPGLGSSYVTWQVLGHQGWSLQALPGTMDVQPVQRRAQGLGELLDVVALAWQDGLRRVARGPWLLGGLVVLGLLIALAVLRRRWLPLALVATALLGLLVLGGIAAGSQGGLDGVHAITSVEASQAMDFLDADAPALSVRVAPTWRLDASPLALLIGCLVAALAAVAAWRWRRLRWPLVGLAVAAVALPAAGFPVLRLVLAHCLTWGLPLALVLLLAWRCLQLRRGQSTPALLALLVLVLVGCGGGGGTRPANETLVVAAIAVDLVAEADSMALTARLELEGPKGAVLPLFAEGMVLLSDPQPQAGLEVQLVEGRHQLVTTSAGSYRCELRFLAPLAPARADGLRQFTVPLPAALTNTLTMDVPPGMQLVCPTAVRFADLGTVEARSRASAILGIGQDAHVLWAPRSRETAREATRHFAEVTAAYRVDTGLIEGRHRVLLRIAQGELRELQLRVPEGMTVTAVAGEQLSTWRFDPATRRLEAVLGRAVSDRYELSVVTQRSVGALPGNQSLGGLVVEGSEHQRSQIGLLPSPSVHVELQSGGARLSPGDFTRQAGALITEGTADQVRLAARLLDVDDALQLTLRAVQPELRSSEVASFSVSDDRLVYNGTYHIDISKAGIYQAQLELPTGYEIDGLAAPGVSHWDEALDDAGRRLLTLHFANRTQGRIELQLGLSTVVGELPAQLKPPRMALLGSLKHRGRLVLSPEQGVRLLLRDRDGVSELDPKEFGIEDDRSLVFALLDPAWTLDLATEVIEPLVHVDALHVARVSEGLIRHEHRLRWRLQHAGSKRFEIELPVDFPTWREAGVSVVGPDLASFREERTAGRRLLQIELTRKWFDRTYPLSIHYETRFDRELGQFDLRPLRPVDVEVQRHHLVVFGSDRVELAERERAAGVLDAEARAVDGAFGAGDLAGAAFCYRGGDAGCAVGLSARRHAAAELLAADVQQAVFQTVFTRTGARMTRAWLELRVGSKRHLEVTLPEGASLWTASVNGRPVLPARRSAEDPTRLLPLANAAAKDVRMEVDLVWVEEPVHRQVDGTLSYELRGPRFDLPLRQVRWTVFAPGDLILDDFGGTLNLDERSLAQPQYVAFDAEGYDQSMAAIQVADNRRAKDLADQSATLCEQGDQYGARLALEWAYNYSLGDEDLNEDARVQLHSLNRQQALVGLVGRRNALQLRKGGGGAEQLDLGERFTNDEAKRLESSLSKDDFGNLRRITDRLVEVQHQAIAPAAQIRVAVPTRGRAFVFHRALQVDPSSPLAISFTGRSAPRAERSWSWGGAVLLVILVSLATALVALAARLLPGLAPRRPDPEDEDATRDDDLLAGLADIPSAAAVGEALPDEGIDTEGDLSAEEDLDDPAEPPRDDMASDGDEGPAKE